jgi:hypothetical protein
MHLDPPVQRKEIAMPLPYTQWPEDGSGNTKTWKARVAPGKVNDVDTDDTLTFALDGSTPKKIKIDTFTCNHTGTPHKAYEWKGIYCKRVASNKVEGKTTSNWDFTIESSEEKDEEGNTYNKLTWTVVKPGLSSACDVGPGGGVCWTAEDG